MMLARRSLLKGAIALPLAAGLVSAPALAAAPPLRLIADRRIAGADRLARRALAQGLPVADPRGELVHLFRGPCADWLADGAPLAGVTYYVDYALMTDLAREHGRRIAAITPQEAGDAVARLLTDAGEQGGGVFAWHIRS